MSDESFAEIVRQHHGNSGGFSRHYLTLYALAFGLEARQVFEFGAGFSTKTLLAALGKTGGHLTTCDIRALAETGNGPEMMQQYKRCWTYLQGDSREQVKNAGKECYDLVLHDGSHEWRVVLGDLLSIIPRMKKNSILLVHDTEHIPTYRLKLAVFLALLFVPHEKVTLPYGYGLTIIRILGNAHNGTVSPVWKAQKQPRPAA